MTHSLTPRHRAPPHTTRPSSYVMKNKQLRYAAQPDILLLTNCRSTLLARLVDFTMGVGLSDVLGGLSPWPMPGAATEYLIIIIVSDHDFLLRSSNFGNLAALRAILALFSLRMRSNGYLRASSENSVTGVRFLDQISF